MYFVPAASGRGIAATWLHSLRRWRAVHVRHAATVSSLTVAAPRHSSLEFRPRPRTTDDGFFGRIAATPAAANSTGALSVAVSAAPRILRLPAVADAEPRWVGVRADLIAGAREMGISLPTEIQSLALPPIMRGESVLLAAATGTGKSLAYLIPLLHRMKNEEDEVGVVTRKRRPRVLVLVPTRELALQVCSVAKRLCHTAKFRVAAVVGGTQQGQQRRLLDSDVDVVIATPGRLAMLLDQNWISLGDVRAVAIDEVDTIVNDNDGFGEELRDVLQRLRIVAPLEGRASAASRNTPSDRSGGAAGTGAAGVDSSETAPSRQQRRVQVVLAGATIPHRALSRIRALFPGISQLTARSAHKPPTALRHRFMRVTADSESKHVALIRIADDAAPAARVTGVSTTDALSGDGSEAVTVAAAAAAGRLLVFCNTIQSARSTAHTLVEAGINAASLHGGIPPELRALEFDAFRSGKAPILVCTDAAARGLDFVGVNQVLLFDFPLSPIEYLHRAGRVARAGRSGTVISLVSNGDVVLARRIQEAVERDRPLTELTGARDDPSSSSSVRGAHTTYKRPGAFGAASRAAAPSRRRTPDRSGSSGSDVGSPRREQQQYLGRSGSSSGGGGGGSRSSGNRFSEREQPRSATAQYRNSRPRGNNRRDERPPSREGFRTASRSSSDSRGSSRSRGQFSASSRRGTSSERRGGAASRSNSRSSSSSSTGRSGGSSRRGYDSAASYS